MKILINEKLQALGRTNKWLSEITGIPYSSMNRIIKGEDLKLIPVAEFDKICTALDCKLSDILITEEDDIIKEKVKLENLKIAINEGATLIKSLNKLKAMANYQDNSKFDEVEDIICTLLKTTIFNKFKDVLKEGVQVNKKESKDLRSFVLYNSKKKKNDNNPNLFRGVGGLDDLKENKNFLHVENLCDTSVSNSHDILKSSVFLNNKKNK